MLVCNLKAWSLNACILALFNNSRLSTSAWASNTISSWTISSGDSCSNNCRWSSSFLTLCWTQLNYGFGSWCFLCNSNCWGWSFWSWYSSICNNWSFCRLCLSCIWSWWLLYCSCISLGLCTFHNCGLRWGSFCWAASGSRATSLNCSAICSSNSLIKCISNFGLSFEQSLFNCVDSFYISLGDSGYGINGWFDDSYIHSWFHNSCSWLYNIWNNFWHLSTLYCRCLDWSSNFISSSITDHIFTHNCLSRFIWCLLWPLWLRTSF